MKTVNIYGEPVSGTIIKERTNVPLSVDEMIQSGLRFSHDEWLDKKE